MQIQAFGDLRHRQPFANPPVQNPEMVRHSLALVIGQQLLHGVLELFLGPGGKEWGLRFRPGIVPDPGPIDPSDVSMRSLDSSFHARDGKGVWTGH